MRVLITGASGFSGRHLTRYLHESGVEVFGVGRSAQMLPFDRDHWIAADVRERDQIHAIVKMVRPDSVFHLAGVRPRTPMEFRAALDIHGYGTINLLDSVALYAPQATVVVASSSSVYGTGAQVALMPSHEQLPLCPVALYGVSKTTQEMAARCHQMTSGLKVLIARTFNIIGPGEGPGTVAGAIACQIADIEAGTLSPSIRIGATDRSRDFCDVRDVVRAYVLLSHRGKSGEVYNVCSGRAGTVQQVLNLLLSMSSIPIKVERFSPSGQEVDIPFQVGDNSLIQSHTGWCPTISLEQSLADLLNECRRQIRQNTKDMQDGL